MSRRKPKPKSSRGKQQSRTTPPNRRRQWFFRIAAMLLIPALLLAFTEIGLRVSGYGYPTSFFRKAIIGGKECIVENRQFGLRFFEPGAIRTPSPIVFPAQKPPDTLRIFLFGESAALGDPYPAYGMGRYLEILLRDRYPQKKFEVICVAMTAINSHVIVPIARECEKYGGDLWIIYAGNNEMIGPGGGARMGKLIAPNLRLLRASFFLKKFRLGQWIDAMAHGFGPKDKSEGWQGLGAYQDRKIAPGDPARAQVDENFGRNLDTILNSAERAKANVLLCPVSGNLADWSPHLSMHSPGISADSLAEWEKLYRAGQGAADANRPGEALEAFGRATAIDPNFAEAHYRAGLSHLQLSNTAAARKEFQLALDDDAMPVRTTSPRNEVIRTSGRRHAQTQLVEMEENLAKRCASGISGHEVFLDHVHFTFNGNYIAARALADGVEKTFGLSPQNSAPWLSQSKCEGALGMTDWNRNMVLYIMLRRLTEPFYTNQFTNPKSRRELQAQMAAYQRNLKENPPSESLYKDALKSRPDDHFILENYAWFLEWKENLAAASDQWRKVTELLPHHPVAYFQAARLHFKIGKFQEGEAEIAHALKIRPDYSEAQVELGRAYRYQGKKIEALATFRAALAQNPNDPLAHFEFGDALIASNQKSEGFAELQTAIRLSPEFWKPRYSLGVELALLGKDAEAAQQFSEVTRLEPDFSPAHLNLGVSLAKQNRIREAMEQFQQTVSLDPSNKTAQQMLEATRSMLKQNP
jgi:tetratricopeptide (TPR) repeat protein